MSFPSPIPGVVTSGSGGMMFIVERNRSFKDCPRRGDGPCVSEILEDPVGEGARSCGSWNIGGLSASGVR